MPISSGHLGAGSNVFVFRRRKTLSAYFCALPGRVCTRGFSQGTADLIKIWGGAYHLKRNMWEDKTMAEIAYDN